MVLRGLQVNAAAVGLEGTPAATQKDIIDIFAASIGPLSYLFYTFIDR